MENIHHDESEKMQPFGGRLDISKAPKHKGNYMEKKLFFVVDDGVEFHITVAEGDLLEMIKDHLAEYDKDTPNEDLPDLTVTPFYMTQEEFDNMPEYNG